MKKYLADRFCDRCNHTFAFISSTGTDLFTVLLLIVGAILVFIGLKGRKVEANPNVLPILTKEKEAHYLKSGMSPSEIELFLRNHESNQTTDRAFTKTSTAAIN